MRFAIIGLFILSRSLVCAQTPSESSPTSITVRASGNASTLSINDARDILQNYSKDNSDPEVMVAAVRLAGRQRAVELIDPLIKTITFVYAAQVDNNVGLPLEDNFPVVKALSEMGPAAVKPIVLLLKDNPQDTMKGQLALRALVLIEGTNTARRLQQEIALGDDTHRNALLSHIDALWRYYNIR